MHNQIGGTKINEGACLICVAKQRLQNLNELLFTFVVKNDILFRLENLETLVKRLLAILLRHVVLEVFKATRRYVDHLFLRHVPVKLRILVRVIRARASHIGRCPRLALRSIIIAVFLLVRWHRSLVIGKAARVGRLLRTTLHVRVYVFHILIVFVVEKGRIFVFLHVAARRLVNIQIGHAIINLLLPLFELLLALSFLHSSLSLLLLLLLNFLELLENVLIMKQSVRKFLLKLISLQILCNARRDSRMFQQFVDGRSLLGVCFQHHANYLGHLG